MRVFRLTFEKAVVIFEIYNLILSPKKTTKKQKIPVNKTILCLGVFGL